jgi:hypothetical protein
VLSHRLVKSNAHKAIDYYNYASVLLQELDVAIDDRLLFTLLEFAQSLPLDKLAAKADDKPSVVDDDKDKTKDDDKGTIREQTSFFLTTNNNIVEAYLRDDEALALTADAVQRQRKVYFEILHLNPMKLNVTFEITKGIGAFITNPVVRTLGDTLVSTVGNLDGMFSCLFFDVT